MPVRSRARTRRRARRCGVVADFDLHAELLVARDLDGEARFLAVAEAVVMIVFAIHVDGDRVAAGRERVRVDVLPVVRLEVLRRRVDRAVVERDDEATDFSVVAVGAELNRDARVEQIVVAHRGDARAERRDVTDELVVIDRRCASVHRLRELVRRGVQRRSTHAAVAHLAVHHRRRRYGLSRRRRPFAVAMRRLRPMPRRPCRRTDCRRRVGRHDGGFGGFGGLRP